MSIHFMKFVAQEAAGNHGPARLSHDQRNGRAHRSPRTRQQGHHPLESARGLDLSNIASTNRPCGGARACRAATGQMDQDHGLVQITRCHDPARASARPAHRTRREGPGHEVEIRNVHRVVGTMHGQRTDRANTGPKGLPEDTIFSCKFKGTRGPEFRRVPGPPGMTLVARSGMPTTTSARD